MRIHVCGSAPHGAFRSRLTDAPAPGSTAAAARLDAEPRPVLTVVPLANTVSTAETTRPCKHTLELRKKIRLKLWPVV